MNKARYRTNATGSSSENEHQEHLSRGLVNLICDLKDAKHLRPLARGDSRESTQQAPQEERMVQLPSHYQVSRRNAIGYMRHQFIHANVFFSYTLNNINPQEPLKHPLALLKREACHWLRLIVFHIEERPASCENPARDNLVVARPSTDSKSSESLSQPEQADGKS
ncbi:hypothetical protein BD289DRAFT_456696 [Coniella lustricola]|uniref:Uncharacterized protein n=1 Tax=Coniella lustricola TaxID=2025994 RepID=A0A2T2ZUU4_9PEZI|nr:hypothetical protein BD289DRAFT_456696 [Coniella lustricola]